LTERENLKRNLIIFSASLFLFIVGNYYIFGKLEKVKDISNPYVFLFILNLDLIFFIIIFAYTLRYLIKILFEEGIKGKLKIKLTLILISFVVIPSLILFTVSVSIISSATNLWFAGKVGNALGKLDEILSQNIQSNQDWLYRVYRLIDENKIDPKDAVDILNLRTLTIYDTDGRLIQFYGKPYDKEVFDALYKEGFSVYENKIVFNGKLKTNQKIILVYEFPKELLLSKEDTALILQIYNDLKNYKAPIRISYILILLTITMAVIFATVWFSRFIVNNITKPVEALVEGAKRLSEGDLNVKINLKSQDEFGILIEEFNRMVERLNLLYKKLEERNAVLRKNKEYLETILNNISTGVIYSSEDGKIENINNAATFILGQDVLNFRKSDIQEFAKFLNINLDSKKEQIIEKGGRTLIVKVSNIRDKGYVIVFDDITDIIAAQKLSMWKDVAQRIAHEIKNPLTPIKLSAERILRSWKKQNPNFDEIVENSVKIITQETDYLANLVREFNQFGSSLSGLNVQEIDLCNLLRELTESYKDEKFSISIECEDDFKIKGDLKLLKQAFINIVQNSYEEASSLKIPVYKEGSKIKIIFKDNGKGISKEDADKIFLPYYSKKPKGSGLGLSIAKEVVEKHKGKIYAVPSSEGGIFVIELSMEA
jgi:two-component system nitrogen regulation sensor histidine kinase NtrY